MKTTINNTMVLAATLLLSVFLFTFCTQTVENPKGEDALDKLDDALQEFRTVGLLHNEIMDEVLDDFRNHDGRFEDREGYFEFLEESLVRNLADKSFLSSVHDEELKKTVRDMLSVIETGEVDRHLTKSGLMDLVTTDMYVMSTELNFLLQQVDEIIMSALSDVELIRGLQRIASSTIVQTLPYEDKQVFYATIAVGIESTLYWEENLEYWVSSLSVYDISYSETIMSFRLNGRRIIRGDVEGAVAGAIGGCMAGALAGGVGCGPGAASGALIASATASSGKAVRQILDSFF